MTVRRRFAHIPVPSIRHGVRAMTSKSAIALRHVHFEDLGHFAPVLERYGYGLTYCDIGVESIEGLDPLAADLLIVLGGPIGVYEEEQYPFLGAELALLSNRLTANRPTLGICLGCQLIARALGARVYPMGVKEIGFSPIRITPEGMRSCLSALAKDGTVLHWHGDTFDLPSGAVNLAYTETCPNQAFTFGPNVLGLQFHLEIPATRFERWLIGHACELAAAGMSVADLRSAAQHHAPMLARNAEDLLGRWLRGGTELNDLHPRTP
jgi:GMP synthase (glutamine-hydrolysing)